MKSFSYPKKRFFKILKGEREQRMEAADQGGKSAKKTRNGDGGVRAEVQGDETVEEYVLRICEEQANELRAHGEAKIQEFIEEAAKAKKAASSSKKDK